MIFPMLALSSAQGRLPRSAISSVTAFGAIFELNFGRYLPAFGRADDDDAGNQRD